MILRIGKITNGCPLLQSLGTRLVSLKSNSKYYTECAYFFCINICQGNECFIQDFVANVCVPPTVFNADLIPCLMFRPIVCVPLYGSCLRRHFCLIIIDVMA